MTFEKIIQKIDTLPPLSNAANTVRSLHESGLEMMSVSSLIRVLESDAMLIANMLRIINSPFYGMRKNILSAKQAISLLGTHIVYMFIVKYSIEQTIKADTSVYGFDTNQFNELCHLQSALLFQWYSQINLQNAKKLSQLALIMESGKLLLANEVIKSDYIGEFRKGFNECENVVEYEKNLIGESSYKISAELFKHWNLDEYFVDVLNSLDYDEKKLEEEDAYLKRDRAIIDIIITTINVKDVLTDESIKKASKKVSQMGYSRHTFEKTAYKVRDAYFR